MALLPVQTQSVLKLAFIAALVLVPAGVRADGQIDVAEIGDDAGELDRAEAVVNGECHAQSLRAPDFLFRRRMELAVDHDLGGVQRAQLVAEGDFIVRLVIFHQPAVTLANIF